MFQKKISVRYVTKEYASMLKMMEGEPEQDNKINVYRCVYGHNTVTKDVDKGTTPFMHECGHDECKGMGKSNMYQVPQHLTPTQEWYRPTLQQCLKMRKKDPGLLDHVLQGGLEFRKIEK